MNMLQQSIKTAAENLEDMEIELQEALAQLHYISKEELADAIDQYFFAKQNYHMLLNYQALEQEALTQWTC